MYFDFGSACVAVAFEFPALNPGGGFVTSIAETEIAEVYTGFVFRVDLAGRVGFPPTFEKARFGDSTAVGVAATGLLTSGLFTNSDSDAVTVTSGFSGLEAVSATSLSTLLGRPLLGLVASFIPSLR